jgi:hypothetical protein
VVVVAYGVGTFLPNEYAYKKISNKIEEFYTGWALNIGLHEPSFE